MENPLESELEIMARAALSIKEKAKLENICQDDYETKMIDALDAVGIQFDR